MATLHPIQFGPRRRVWLAAQALALACLLPVCRAQSEHPTFTNVSVHDPAVLRVDSTYYVFGSHLASASTTDLMNWTQISTSPADGNALVPHPSVEFSEALAWAQTTTFWAPDVIRLADGKFRFYYCACKGDSPRSALGLAISDAATGPYRNLGILLKSGMWGQVSPDGTIYDNAVHPNTVDPSVFLDQSGQLWIVYGSYSGGIFILKLDPATGLVLDGQGYGKKLIGGNNTTIEGPTITYSPETQYYYLFFTFGGLDANGGYNVRYGRSRTPDGPYLDAAGNDLTNVKGAFGTLFDNTSIAPYAVKLMGNWQFLHTAGDVGSVSHGYVSPGGASIYRDPIERKYLMVFHTRFVGRGEAHEVRVHQLYLNAEGWFVAAPHRYAHETIATLDPNQLPGDFKLILFSKTISAAVSTSQLVTFHVDHSISGAVAGSWQSSGDHNLTLVLNGAVYQGVVSRQWDDDNQTWVMAFSAVSTAGVPVWGSQVASAPIDAAPTITVQPQGQGLAYGQAVTLSVGTTGSPAPTYQWQKDGAPIAGATNYSYPIVDVTGEEVGNYTVVVANRAGSVTSAVAALTLPAPPAQVDVPAGDGAAQIVNLSTRGIVSTGDNALIAGFAISGPASKKLLITGWGLNLRRFGLTGEIGRPHLALVQRVNGVNVTLAVNSDWQTGSPEVPALIAQNGGQALSASTDPAHGDAALVVTLPAGSYTVVATPDASSATADGIGLVELYDADRANGSKLVNISSRGRIETGARQMIVGVSLAGSGHSRLLIRGVGPTLTAFGLSGVLQNPSETLYHNADGVQTVVTGNDDWWNSAQATQIKDLSPRIGAFDLGRYSADAVLLLQVAPGSYSAIISPSSDQPGVALAEVYDANGP